MKKMPGVSSFYISDVGIKWLVNGRDTDLYGLTVSHIKNDF